MIRTTFFLNGLSGSISNIMPMVFGIAVFTTYDLYFETKLSSAQIYALITLFNSFINLIRFYMMALLNRTDSGVAADRINLLFSVDPVSQQANDPSLRKGALEIKDADFNWEDAKYFTIFEKKTLEKKDQSLKILSDINLSV